MRSVHTAVQIIGPRARAEHDHRGKTARTIGTRWQPRVFTLSDTALLPPPRHRLSLRCSTPPLPDSRDETLVDQTGLHHHFGAATQAERCGAVRKLIKMLDLRNKDAVDEAQQTLDYFGVDEHDVVTTREQVPTAEPFLAYHRFSRAFLELEWSKTCGRRASD